MGFVLCRELFGLDCDFEATD